MSGWLKRPGNKRKHRSFLEIHFMAIKLQKPTACDAEVLAGFRLP